MAPSYNVANTQPRPESYREDYITATNTSYHSESGEVYQEQQRLNGTQLASVYANLASGAESGWDFTSRWMSRPSVAVNDTFFPLRYLNTVNIVPVDLNSILYGNEVAIAKFLRMSNRTSEARSWDTRARRRSEAMHALMWNETLHSYFDYNLTSSSQNLFFPVDNDTAPFETESAPEGMQVAFSVAQYYPFWTGAAAARVRNDPEEVGRAYARVARYLEVGPGGIPATNLRTGEQWDEPSVWPPLMYILISGLLNNNERHADNTTVTGTPSNTTWSGTPYNNTGIPYNTTGIPNNTTGMGTAYNTTGMGIPYNNTGVEIPYNNTGIPNNTTGTGPPNNTTGVGTPNNTTGTGTPQYNTTGELALALAQRYLDSTFCTWYATGGSTSETPQLEGFTDQDVGIMFEKYDSNSTNVAGGGGEYEVVEGFGWTNGVLIWIVERFGNELKRPDCGNISPAHVNPSRK